MNSDYLTVDHARDVRRRYLARATRNVVRRSLRAARANGGNAAGIALVSAAAISVVLWVVPHV